MEIRNLTPHPVTFTTENGSLVIPPDGVVARVAVERSETDAVTIAGVTIPVVREILGEVEGLPERKDNTILVVSRMVANTCRRDDLVFPTDFVRDDTGAILDAKAMGTSW